MIAFEKIPCKLSKMIFGMTITAHPVALLLHALTPNKYLFIFVCAQNMLRLNLWYSNLRAIPNGFTLWPLLPSRKTALVVLSPSIPEHSLLVVFLLSGHQFHFIMLWSVSALAKHLSHKRPALYHRQVMFSTCPCIARKQNPALFGPSAFQK